MKRAENGPRVDVTRDGTVGRLLMDRLRFDGVAVVHLVSLGVSRVKMLPKILGCCRNRRKGSA